MLWIARTFVFSDVWTSPLMTYYTTSTYQSYMKEKHIVYITTGHPGVLPRTHDILPAWIFLDTHMYHKNVLHKLHNAYKLMINLGRLGPSDDEKKEKPKYLESLEG